MPASADMPIPPIFVPLSLTYSSDELILPWKDILNEGVVNKAGGYGLVSQRAAGANFSVDVAALTKGAYVQGDDDANAQGLYRVRSAAIVNLAITPNVSGSTRIDRVIARVYDQTFAGALNKWTLEILEGVPGGAAPALPNNAISLATISQATGAASITNAMITDTRADYSLCAALSTGGGGGTAAFADILLAVDTATFDVQSIPAGMWLKLLIAARGTQASSTAAIQMRANNDSGANYDHGRLRARGTTVDYVETFAATAGNVGESPAASATALKYAAARVMIPHYSGAINHKTAVCDSTDPETQAAGNFNLQRHAWLWRSAAAINRITLLSAGGSFKADSRLTLYANTT